MNPACRAQTSRARAELENAPCEVAPACLEDATGRTKATTRRRLHPSPRRAWSFAARHKRILRERSGSWRTRAVLRRRVEYLRDLVLPLTGEARRPRVPDGKAGRSAIPSSRLARMLPPRP